MIEFNMTAPSLDDLHRSRRSAERVRERANREIAALESAIAQADEIDVDAALVETLSIAQAEADEQAAQADEIDSDAALVETLSAMQRTKLDAVRDMLVRKADEARALCTRADEQDLTAIRERARTRYRAYSTALVEFDRLTH